MYLKKYFYNHYINFHWIKFFLQSSYSFDTIELSSTMLLMDVNLSPWSDKICVTRIRQNRHCCCLVRLFFGSDERRKRILQRSCLCHQCSFTRRIQNNILSATTYLRYVTKELCSVIASCSVFLRAFRVTCGALITSRRRSIRNRNRGNYISVVIFFVSLFSSFYDFPTWSWTHARLRLVVTPRQDTRVCGPRERRTKKTTEK